MPIAPRCSLRHPHLHRAPRGARQGVLHARRHRRALPGERRAHRRGAGRGGVASPGARARLLRRERVHQGREDHPVLHGHRGQDGVEEALAISVTACCVRPPSDGLPLVGDDWRRAIRRRFVFWWGYASDTCFGQALLDGHAVLPIQTRCSAHSLSIMGIKQPFSTSSIVLYAAFFLSN